MRIAVPSSGRTLESPVDPRFGRSPYFIIINTDTMEHHVLTNTRISAPGGVEAAQLVAKEEPDVVLAGALGPKSSKLLSQAGIKIIKGVSGTVKEAVADFMQREI
jgi:predicted Fe-Mo cluster-binding NifX family protein